MATSPVTVKDWLHIVQGEFLEMPGLHLTKPQARRLWGLNPDTCDAILDALVASKFLQQTRDGAYTRTDPRKPALSQRN